MRKTKIVCTLGPSTDEDAVLRQMMLSGMDVARLNFSHQTHIEHKVRIEQIKRMREELSLPVAILADTKGPEIRTGAFKQKVQLHKGQSFILTTKQCIGSDSMCQISFENLPHDVIRGTRILVDDGLIELEVESTTDSDIACTVLNDGVISSNKGINVPGVRLSIPFLSSKDRSDIRFAVEEGCDFIALSFTRSAEDVLQVRQELTRHGDSTTKLIAKIENAEGVADIDRILKAADGIMVARGDMGVEIPLEEIPVIQKSLITKSYGAGKQVITATQMLESMMKNPRPTRAETTDVANAIFDGTSAIMLSGETAAGDYPIEAIKTMARIAERAERAISYKDKFRAIVSPQEQGITNAISHATCTTAHDLDAAAIITVTKSGATARMISKYRPAVKIISCTTSKKVQRQMNLSWGVTPLLIDEMSNTDELFRGAVEAAVKAGLISDGDLVVITSGVPVGMSGLTNLLKVHVVGDPLD